MNPLRLKWTLVVAAVTTALVAILYPQQLGVLLFKANVLALAAIAGYYLDRGIFPYARPSETYPYPTWMLRRVALIAAVMISASLAL